MYWEINIQQYNKARLTQNYIYNHQINKVEIIKHNKLQYTINWDKL